jgi:hypothetical protein
MKRRAVDLLFGFDRVSGAQFRLMQSLPRRRRGGLFLRS